MTNHISSTKILPILATDNEDYDFDLNEFFSATKSKFVHEVHTEKVLDTFATLEILFIKK